MRTWPGTQEWPPPHLSLDSENPEAAAEWDTGPGPRGQGPSHGLGLVPWQPRGEARSLSPTVCVVAGWRADVGDGLPAGVPSGRDMCCRSPWGTAPCGTGDVGVGRAGADGQPGSWARLARLCPVEGGEWVAEGAHVLQGAEAPHRNTPLIVALAGLELPIT